MQIFGPYCSKGIHRISCRFQKRGESYNREPIASCQKGSLENNHKEFRHILTKNTDLRA